MEVVAALVVVAGVAAPEGNGGGRVNLAGGPEALTERGSLPLDLAALGVDGVHVAAIVAYVESAAVVGGGRLDRATEAGGPAHVAADRAQRVEVAVLAAEVDGSVDHDRRGLGA